MRILLISYKKSRQFLVLELGKRQGKLCCIATSEIPDHERKILKDNIKNLPTMTLSDKITFIKDNCIISYNKGYKEIRTDNIEIIESYTI